MQKRGAGDSANTAKYAVLAALITSLIGGVGAAVVSNWDKLFGSKPVPAPVVAAQNKPSQQSGGAQSPNINGARDITIEYGAAAKEPDRATEQPSDIAGKWRTPEFKGEEDPEGASLTMEFIRDGYTLSGTVTETVAGGRNSVVRVIDGGKISGQTISFFTHGEYGLGAGETHQYKETYFGTANKAASEIAFRRLTDIMGGPNNPEKFTATRVK